jgi:hypothetical protein
MPVGHRSRAPSGEKQGRLGDEGREAEGERERAGGKGGGRERDGRGQISVFVDKGERCIISALPLPHCYHYLKMQRESLLVAQS